MSMCVSAGPVTVTRIKGHEYTRVCLRVSQGRECVRVWSVVYLSAHVRVVCVCVWPCEFVVVSVGG